MQINSSLVLNNISSMRLNEKDLEQASKTIATASLNSNNSSLTSGVTEDLINSIVGQIPTIISYEANAKAIETTQAVADVLLDLKA